MKNASYLILFVLLVSITYGQNQIATTDAGKTVILKTNGYWEYLNENVCSSFDLKNYYLAKRKIILGQNYDYYFNKAWQYVDQVGEKSYDAVANFEEAVKLHPTSGGVYSDLGNCYRGGFKCFEKAELYYTKAIENGFTEGFVYYNRAICRFELNKLEEMRMDLKTSRELGWYHDYYKLSTKNACFEMDESTFALWRFDDGSGNNFINEVGGKNGILKGNPTWVDGKFGKALHFDGIDDFGDCQINPPENNCTYEIWYKPDEPSDKDGWIWMGWGLYNAGFIVRGDTLHLCEFNDALREKAYYLLEPKKWNYIAFVISSDPCEQALYINGIKVAYLKNIHIPTWNSLWLAVDQTFGSNHFLNGTIDEFRISNRARTPKEINEIWKNH